VAYDCIFGGIYPTLGTFEINIGEIRDKEEARQKETINQGKAIL